MFREAGFKLYKWHQNDPALEGTELVNETDFRKTTIGHEIESNENSGSNLRKG